MALYISRRGAYVACFDRWAISRASIRGASNRRGSTFLFFMCVPYYIINLFCCGSQAEKNLCNLMATEYLYINTRDELLRFDCSKIVYMEGDGNYTNIVLVNKLKASVCMNLSDMQRLISESLKERASMFARIGKRFIVNLNYIYHINVLRQSLTVTDGVHFAFQLGISKEALKQLKQVMIDHANSKKLTTK